MSVAESEFESPEIHDVGILPVRTADLEEAMERVRTDGAVVLTGLGRTAEAAEVAARAVFGSTTLAVPPAAEIRLIGDGIVRNASPEEVFGVDTDGFGYGDDNPDYFLLLCSQDSAIGGESVLIDAYRVLDELGGTAHGAALVERLEQVAVDQTQRGMHRSVSPTIGGTARRRRRAKRFPGLCPLADWRTPDADAAVIRAWGDLCRKSAIGAPPFKLAPGEAVIVDNYRVLHGRVPYTEGVRLLWRVWIWTDAVHGVPAGALASNRRHARVSTAIAASGWPMITNDSTSRLPTEVREPEEAGKLLTSAGTAILWGVASESDAVDAARAVLGKRALRITPQFEGTTFGHLASAVKMSPAGSDRWVRIRKFTPPDEVTPAHNDGYSFGDLAPDYLFLWCDVADKDDGGATWLVDGSALLRALAADDATKELADFCYRQNIDHSEPGFVMNPPSPIARCLPSGREQARHNPYQAPVEGAEPGQALMVTAWSEAVRVARDRADRFHLKPGQLLCVDNYRMLHGRDPYTDLRRRLVAAWAWTTDAVAIPDRDLSPV